MTAGWESLGDWLHDQARELGHIVKPRPRPVAVPSLEDMPLTESVPVCEVGADPHTRVPRCWDAATLRVVMHVSEGMHGDILKLMCDKHWENYRNYIERMIAEGPFYCDGDCGLYVTRLCDVVKTVIPL